MGDLHILITQGSRLMEKTLSGMLLVTMSKGKRILEGFSSRG